MSAFDPERIVHALASLPDCARIWVAYSGGLDSTCLLRAAAAVRERLPGNLAAVHVDHGLDPGSATWAAHCRSQCEALGVPLVVRTLDLRLESGQSPEAAARDARYAELSALLAPGDLLLTAHNQDDQAETLLLALIRGSGVHGLAAMPALAELGLGFLVRPLLDTTRAELAAYAATLGLDWIEDPSNDSLSLDRNYLRNLVLPLVRQRWPAASATFARSAAHCAEAAAAIDQVAGALLRGLGGEHPGTLAMAGLARIELPLRKAVIRLWLRRRGFALPDTVHLGRILNEVLPARPDADPLVAWSGCEVRRYRGDLFALRPLPSPPDTTPLPWPGGVLELPGPLGTLIREDRDHEGIAPPLMVRFGVTEQSCRAGGSDHERPLKKVFQDHGIPAWLRPYAPMVFDGDRLVAVAGVCACRAGGPADSTGAVRVRWSGHPWEGAGFFGG